MDFVAFHEQKDKESTALINQNREQIKAQKETQMELISIGSSIQNASIADNDRKKKNAGKDQNEYAKRADARIMDNEKLVDEKMSAQSSLTQNDRNRQRSIVETEDKKERIQKNNEA